MINIFIVSMEKKDFVMIIKKILHLYQILSGTTFKEWKEYCKSWSKNAGVFNGGRGACNSKATDNLKRMACEVGVELGKKGYYPDNDDELESWDLYNIYLEYNNLLKNVKEIIVEESERNYSSINSTVSENNYKVDNTGKPDGILSEQQCKAYADSTSGKKWHSADSWDSKPSGCIEHPPTGRVFYNRNSNNKTCNTDIMFVLKAKMKK